MQTHTSPHLPLPTRSMWLCITTLHLCSAAMIIILSPNPAGQILLAQSLTVLFTLPHNSIWCEIQTQSVLPRNCPICEKPTVSQWNSFLHLCTTNQTHLLAGCLLPVCNYVYLFFSMMISGMNKTVSNSAQLLLTQVLTPKTSAHSGNLNGGYE